MREIHTYKYKKTTIQSSLCIYAYLSTARFLFFLLSRHPLSVTLRHLVSWVSQGEVTTGLYEGNKTTQPPSPAHANSTPCAHTHTQKKKTPPAVFSQVKQCMISGKILIQVCRGERDNGQLTQSREHVGVGEGGGESPSIFLQFTHLPLVSDSSICSSSLFFVFWLQLFCFCDLFNVVSVLSWIKLLFSRVLSSVPILCDYCFTKIFLISASLRKARIAEFSVIRRIFYFILLWETSQMKYLLQLNATLVNATVTVEESLKELLP